MREWRGGNTYSKREGNEREGGGGKKVKEREKSERKVLGGKKIERKKRAARGKRQIKRCRGCKCLISISG